MHYFIADKENKILKLYNNLNSAEQAAKKNKKSEVLKPGHKNATEALAFAKESLKDFKVFNSDGKLLKEEEKTKKTEKNIKKDNETSSNNFSNEIETNINKINNENDKNLLLNSILKGLNNLEISDLLKVFSDFNIGFSCVDGAMKDNKMGYAYALISGGVMFEDSSEFTSDVVNSTRAEIMAIRQVIGKAVALGIKELIICYDCEGAFSTLTRENRSSVPEINEYRSFYKIMSSLIKIHFVKVKGHSGKPLHTRVDIAAGIKVGRNI